MINGSRMATRGIVGVFGFPVRLFSNAGWKGKMFMVAIVGVFMTVGMISANSTASKTAGVEQQRWAQDAKTAAHYARLGAKVPANCKTKVTVKTTTGGKHNTTSRTVTKECN